jgi:1,4-dihydroxy-2-naphthoyl-CoA hydrolase
VAAERALAAPPAAAAAVRPIWHGEWTLEELARLTRGTLAEHLGIAFVEIGADYLRATLAVDARTSQRAGLLHGGASVAMAEVVGMLASGMCLDPGTHYTVALSVDASHVRPVPAGQSVTATASPVHLGRQSHVWSVGIATDDGRLACLARLTAAIQQRINAS